MSDRNQGWLRLLHFAVLALVVVLAYKFIDFREVLQLVGSADRRLLIVLLVVSTIDRFVMSWKWWLLLRSLDVKASLPAVVSCYYQASFLCFIPFMVVGADLFRGYHVVKRGGRTGAVVASMVMEKAIAIVSASIIGVLGLMFVLRSLDREHAGIITVSAVGMLIFSVAGLAASLHEPLYRRIMGLLAKFLPHRLCDKLDNFYGSYIRFGSRPGVLAFNLGVALAEHCLQVMIYLFAGWALGVDVPTGLFIAVIGLVLLLRRAAMYLEGWGMAETVSVVLFSLLAMDVNSALTISLLGHGVGLVAVLPGLFLFVRGGAGVSDLRSARLEESSG